MPLYYMHPCIVVATTEITTTFTTMASTNSSSTSSIQTMSDNKTVLAGADPGLSLGGFY